jgi:hypothetical protein
MGVKIRVFDSHQMQMFLEEENCILKSTLYKIKSSVGATFCLSRRELTILHSTTLQKQMFWQ